MRKRLDGTWPALFSVMGLPIVMLLAVLAAEAGWIATALGSERTPLGTFVNAWVFGAAAAFLVGYGAIHLIAHIALTAKWNSFSIRLGPIKFFEFTGRTGPTLFTLTFRGELVLFGLLGGLLYGLAMLLLAT